MNSLFSKKYNIQYFQIVFITQLTVLTMFVTSSSTLYAQNLDHILKKHFAAVGQTNFESIRSLKVEVTEIDGFGKGQKYFMTKKKPYRIRKEGNRKGEDFVKAFDGDTAWVMIPNQDSLVSGLDNNEKTLLLVESIIGSPLALAKKPQTNMELIGSGYIMRQSNYIIRVSFPNHALADFYVDKKDFLIKKAVTYLDSSAQQVNYEIFYNSYRRLGNFMFSYAQEKYLKNGNRIDVIVGEIVVGIGAPNSIFSPPKK